uniref:Uncharacterized protein n=1 Tax=Aegilops tauschii subsp. strangulata TaxID=200361 RepID=A0A453LRZ2_AEGTS
MSRSGARRVNRENWEHVYFLWLILRLYLLWRIDRVFLPLSMLANNESLRNVEPLRVEFRVYLLS